MRTRSSIRHAVRSLFFFGVSLVSFSAFAEDCNSSDSGGSSTSGPSNTPACSSLSATSPCDQEGETVMSRKCDPSACKAIDCIKASGSTGKACVNL